MVFRTDGTDQVWVYTYEHAVEIAANAQLAQIIEPEIMFSDTARQELARIYAELDEDGRDEFDCEVRANIRSWADFWAEQIDREILEEGEWWQAHPQGGVPHCNRCFDRDKEIAKAGRLVLSSRGSERRESLARLEELEQDESHDEPPTKESCEIPAVLRGLIRD